MDASLFARIWQAAAGEFADVPDAAAVTRVMLRLLIAGFLAGLIGYERERRSAAAGLRTHMLVGVGSALFILVPQQAGADSADLSRVMQGLVAGIGFLGAGAILKGRSGDDVKGVTTAASLWATSAIGMAAGLGRESTAFIATLIVLAILSVLLRLDRLMALPDGDSGDGDADSGDGDADRGA